MVVRTSGWRRYTNAIIALEISAATRYYDRVVQHSPTEGDSGLLFELIECAKKETNRNELPDLRGESSQRSAVLLNGALNHSADIQRLLSDIGTKLSDTSRVIAVMYNPYFGWIYKAANKLGIRSGPVPQTFVTSTDLLNLAALSGFRVVRTRSVLYCPFKLFGIGSLINAIMPALPLLRHLSLTSVVFLAPRRSERRLGSLTIVIPARNERGNIKPALDAIEMHRNGLPKLEIIFVEGHSTDGTWEEIQKLAPLYASSFAIRTLRQEGIGKSDAVRLGFSNATGDLITVLDADLTMPPELLHRFWDAYRNGDGDFVNGNRLVYSMEAEAMQPLNRAGNRAFAKVLSRVLSVPIGDTLCGTKLMPRHDYERFVAWRREFGDFDPFGDFELLFPAAVMALRIVDVPVRYRARTYGSTNISRFRHGWMLLRMTILGFFKIRLGLV